MEIGIDSFAATDNNKKSSSKANALAIARLIDRIEFADKKGIIIATNDKEYIIEKNNTNNSKKNPDTICEKCGIKGE